MDNYLIDINILLDVVFKRDDKSAAVVERLIDSGSNIYITASMIPTLDYFLTKYKVDKKLFKERLLKKFKIVTTTGKEGADALGYNDSEDVLTALSFKRICPKGIIITKDNKFNSFGLTIITPKDFLSKIVSSPKSIVMLDLAAQYRYMLEGIDYRLLSAVADTKYILGPEVSELEDSIARYHNVKHCIGVSSGTEALVLALRALSIKLKKDEYFDGSDEIITTSFTFTATGDAILRSGATPVFIDIDPKTFNIDHDKVRQYLSSSKKVVGIIPVHLYGQGCEMDEIMKIAKEYNLFVLEDTAQAFGGRYKDKLLGTIGTTGAYSFFPSKNLGGFGDGGMVSTDDEELAELVRMLLKHGGRDKYNVDHIGYNARLDTIQASVLLERFKFIDSFNENRKRIASLYAQGLKDVKGLILPFGNEGHVFNQYTVRVMDGKRDQLQKYLKDKGISTMIYYPIPLHKMKVFDGRCSIFGELTESINACKEVLSLPVDPLMNDKEVEMVIDALRGWLG